MGNVSGPEEMQAPVAAYTVAPGGHALPSGSRCSWWRLRSILRDQRAVRPGAAEMVLIVELSRERSGCLKA